MIKIYPRVAERYSEIAEEYPEITERYSEVTVRYVGVVGMKGKIVERKPEVTYTSR